MTGLPELGQIVKVWPFPGRKVQDGPRPVDHLGGGRWLNAEGGNVIWTSFHLEQYRAGDLMLSDPSPGQDAIATVAPKDKFSMPTVKYAEPMPVRRTED